MRFVREWWAKLRDALDPDMRQNITRLGFVFTVVVGLTGLAAFASANNLLFLLFAALLSTLLVSGFVSRLGLAGLELNLDLPEHIAARTPVHGRVTLTNRKWFNPSFSLRITGEEDSGLRRALYVPVLPPRSSLQQSVDLWFGRRGQYKTNVFWFESRFPFGFAHRRAKVRLEREVIVYPCIQPQPEFEYALDGIAGMIDARQRGRGSDFYRLRPYYPHESARHVDWKATAHTGELQVREFATEQDQTVTIFFDLHLPNGASHDWFELAVDCCAWLLWTLNARGARVRLVTQRYDRRVPDTASVYDVLRYLALVEPIFGARLLVPDDTSVSVTVSARFDEAAAQGWVGPRLPDAVGYVRPVGTAAPVSP